MIELPANRRATLVVDRARAFGPSLVVHGGARVEDLVDRFSAGHSLSEVAAHRPRADRPVPNRAVGQLTATVRRLSVRVCESSS
jgi:hypothetical protein